MNAIVDIRTLPITRVAQPPPNLRGLHSDGIEFYCCWNSDCDSAWATQWTETPRKRLHGVGLGGQVPLAYYKRIAVWKICSRCRNIIKAADNEKLNKLLEDCDTSAIATVSNEETRNKLFIFQQRYALRSSDRGLTAAMANPLPSIPTSDPAQEDKNQKETITKDEPKTRVKLTGSGGVSGSSHADHERILPPSSKICLLCGDGKCTCDTLTSLDEMRDKVLNTRAALGVGVESEDAKEQQHANATATAAEKTHKATKKENAATPFDEIPLTPPKEGIEEFAAKNPSWDVIDDDDANEGWTVINHFGNPAVGHRDAHGDTPTVRP